ncbi:MAG: hypothetical protein HC819_19315 [Cyclobacteriaceae bacterium]|nr:hypothetical protein [Cyclobacteriaceae bacterium]
MFRYTNILFLLIIPFLSKGQGGHEDPDIDFELLKVNSAPSFIILGVEPENIQRPNSPRKFVASIQNAVVNGKIVPNVAIETTPYYWKKPTDSIRFSGREFYNNSGFLNTISKTLSLSLSTSETDSVIFGTLKSGTGMGFGLRFLLVDGKMNPLLSDWSKAIIIREYYEHLDMTSRGISDISRYSSILLIETENFKNNYFDKLEYNFFSKANFNRIINQELNNLLTFLNLPSSNNVDAIESFLQASADNAKNNQAKYLDALNSEYEFPLAKQGFILEMVFGNALLFQENKFNQVAHAKGAIWLTPSYSWNLSKHKSRDISLIELMGVLRYTYNNQKDSVDISDYFDIGLKGQYTSNNLTFALEGIYRYASKVPDDIDKNYTYRLVTSLNYKINSLVTFNFNFGTSFNGNTTTYTDAKELFAIGGLNFGIFNRTGSESPEISY